MAAATNLPSWTRMLNVAIALGCFGYGVEEKTRQFPPQVQPRNKNNKSNVFPGGKHKTHRV
jgi:hypothetical protein